MISEGASQDLGHEQRLGSDWPVTHDFGSEGWVDGGVLCKIVDCGEVDMESAAAPSQVGGS